MLHFEMLPAVSGSQVEIERFILSVVSGRLLRHPSSYLHYNCTQVLCLC